MPIFGFIWFMIFFLFYFDEFSYESLSYEEYAEDFLDMFDTKPAEEIELIYKNKEMVMEYYQNQRKSLPEDLIVRDDSSASSDFDMGRIADAWDSSEVFQLIWMLETLQDEWEYETEVELDDECDLKFSDLEQFYIFLHANRAQNTQIVLNTHETITRHQFSNSGVSPQALQLIQKTTIKLPSDVRRFLYQTDDFRYRYWSNKLLKEQLLLAKEKE